ncbi:putative adenylyltransferase/sulfurtransferase MoeZ [Sporomusa ovata DSM 2662]|nr:ThiF family adenylyltransferase [Sporomusa ovata]EQB28893.1 UBA/THIF-type NAD/FAD binding protein [Sporomusa ovata DSM 2662]
MDYTQVYQRNIGLFTPQQQEKLRNAKVAVAGVGGVGGIQAATLARFGIGELAIMDPGVFDEPDMNRQFAAMVANIGRNKAAATAEMLKEINPFLKLTVYEQSPATEEGLAEFMQGSDIVIDAIDYCGIDYKVMFAQLARKMGIINISAPIPDFGTFMVIFDPQGMTMEEFYCVPADPVARTTHCVPYDQLLEEHHSEVLIDFMSGKCNHISTNAGAACLSGAIVATETALIITGKRANENIAVAPRITYVDMMNRIFETYIPKMHRQSKQ